MSRLKIAVLFGELLLLGLGAIAGHHHRELIPIPLFGRFQHLHQGIVDAPTTTQAQDNALADLLAENTQPTASDIDWNLVLVNYENAMLLAAARVVVTNLHHFFFHHKKLLSNVEQKCHCQHLF